MYFVARTELNRSKLKRLPGPNRNNAKSFYNVLRY